MELIEAIESRTSVKKFKKQKPDWRDIIEAIDTTRYAPMAGNNFTLRFIMVDEPKKIERIAEASQQPFITQTHYVVVVVSNPARPTNAYGERGEIYSRQQAGAAIQNFLLRLHELGLATSWIGHFAEDQIKDLLKIPEGHNVEALFPIGKEFNKISKRKLKTDLNNVLYFNEFKNKKMNKIKKLNV